MPKVTFSIRRTNPGCSNAIFQAMVYGRNKEILFTGEYCTKKQSAMRAIMLVCEAVRGYDCATVDATVAENSKTNRSRSTERRKLVSTCRKAMET